MLGLVVVQEFNDDHKIPDHQWKDNVIVYNDSWTNLHVTDTDQVWHHR